MDTQALNDEITLQREINLEIQNLDRDKANASQILKIVPADDKTPEAIYARKRAEEIISIVDEKKPHQLKRLTASKGRETRIRNIITADVSKKPAWNRTVASLLANIQTRPRLDY